MLYFLRNILQLILAPHKAWEDVVTDGRRPSQLLEKGLYPLLSIVALTAFCHGLYDISTFDVAKSLVAALSQFLSLFLGVMAGRALFEAVMPSLWATPVAPARTATVPIYCIGILAVIQIITNLCPIKLTLLWFLPAFLVIVAWQARVYLDVDPRKSGIYIIFAIATVLVLPVAFMIVFNLLLNI